MSASSVCHSKDEMANSPSEVPEERNLCDTPSELKHAIKKAVFVRLIPRHFKRNMQSLTKFLEQLGRIGRKCCPDTWIIYN